MLCIIDQPIFADDCRCARYQNKKKQGATCANWWGNGVWCYADIRTCPDARKNHKIRVGKRILGASPAACKRGKLINSSIPFIVIDIM